MSYIMKLVTDIKLTEWPMVTFTVAAPVKQVLLKPAPHRRGCICPLCVGRGEK